MNRIARSIMVVLIGAALANPATAQQKEDRRQVIEAEVNALVQRFYTHGVPYGKARRLGPNAVPYLGEVLRLERMKPHWRYAVQVLNYVGAPGAFPILREFILERSRGEIDPDRYYAISAAIVTMGPLARISQPAFQFLADGSNPDSWRAVKWTYGDYWGKKRNLELSRMCINALASSGTEQADHVLTEMLRVGARNPHWAELQDLVPDALTANREIIKEGFENHRKRRDEFYTKGGGKKRR